MTSERSPSVQVFLRQKGSRWRSIGGADFRGFALATICACSISLAFLLSGDKRAGELWLVLGTVCLVGATVHRRLDVIAPRPVDD